MNTIEENIKNTDFNNLEFLCYRFYTDIMEYNWQQISTPSEYCSQKNGFNYLQKIEFTNQKIDLNTGVISSNIFLGLGGLDRLEVDLQNNVTLTRKCIYNSTHYCSEHHEPESILKHESQTVKKSYFPNSHDVEYIYKKSVVTDELIKINYLTNNIEDKILLTNKISDISEMYFDKLPTDFIALITKQKIAIREISISENDPFVIYVVDK